MANKTQIKIGQKVTVTFAWREDEQPSTKNFFTGRVREIVNRTKYAVYIRIEGLENLVPMDRVFIA